MTGDSDQTRQKAEQAVGYQFKDVQLLDQALTHASVAETRTQSNERLEFLGDAILGAVVCEYLYRNYPDDEEGELTKIKSDVVSRRVCAEISVKLNLTDLLELGKGMTSRSHLPTSLAAAVYETMVGAIYLDGGLEPARRFILDHLETYIRQAADSEHQHNFKSVLQQYAQRRLPELPHYVLLDEKGPDHHKAFQVCVELGQRRFASAWGQSKKQAEQQAALLALGELGLTRTDNDGQITLTENH